MHPPRNRWSLGNICKLFAKTMLAVILSLLLAPATAFHFSGAAAIPGASRQP
jgi:hypothetical protein